MTKIPDNLVTKLQLKLSARIGGLIAHNIYLSDQIHFFNQVIKLRDFKDSLFNKNSKDRGFNGGFGNGRYSGGGGGGSW